MPELAFETVTHTMRRLATVGLESCAYRLKALPHQRLDGSIELNERKIEYDLGDGSLRSGKVPAKFMPLPAPPGGFHLAFFRPSFFPKGNPTECKIEVIVITDTQGKEIVGYRFERGLEKDDVHAYTHVQLTRVFGCGFETDWPAFAPTSYPAMPTGCRSPGDTWLAVLVSLYGLSVSPDFGLEAVISEVDKKLKVALVSQILPRSRELFQQAA